MCLECGRSWFETRSGKTRDYKIDICCFSVRNATLRCKSKYGVLGIKIMFPSGALCLPKDCSFSDLALQKSISACWSSTKWTSSHQTCSLISPWYGWKLGLNNYHSLTDTSYFIKKTLWFQQNGQWHPCKYKLCPSSRRCVLLFLWSSLRPGASQENEKMSIPVH